jgi:hypothetical protein
MKVEQANVCLTCDEIYDHNKQCCPLCFERKFIYLPVYLPTLSSQVKEIIKNGARK